MTTAAPTSHPAASSATQNEQGLSDESIIILIICVTAVLLVIIICATILLLRYMHGRKFTLSPIRRPKGTESMVNIKMSMHEVYIDQQDIPNNLRENDMQQMALHHNIHHATIQQPDEEQAKSLMMPKRTSVTENERIYIKVESLPHSDGRDNHLRASVSSTLDVDPMKQETAQLQHLSVADDEMDDGRRQKKYTDSVSLTVNEGKNRNMYKSSIETSVDAVRDGHSWGDKVTRNFLDVGDANNEDALLGNKETNNYIGADEIENDDEYEPSLDATEMLDNELDTIM